MIMCKYDVIGDEDHDDNNTDDDDNQWQIIGWQNARRWL